jgi:signal transduction histidine kinase
MVVVGEFGQGTALLSSAPPGRRERVVALSIAAASALTLVLAAPFARVQLPEIKAFIPAYQAALLITDLITAVLLYGLFARARSVALLVLASGYLFDALMIVPHTLTFPGVFTANGLLGAGVQSTAWLFYFWHGGFVAFLFGYIVLSMRAPVGVRSSGRAVLASVLATTIIVVAITGLTTRGHDWLPVVIQGTDYTLAIKKGISPFICIMTLVAIAMLWPRRNRSVLDLWLLVVLCAWICDVMLSAVLGAHRFDLGFYAGRAFGLLASSVLLVMLLISARNELDEKMRDLEISNHERRRSEAYLAEAQSLTHTGSWAWDPRTNKMLHCSEEVFRIYRLQPREGLPSFEMLLQRIHPDDRDRIRESTVESARQKIERLLEFRIVLPDGTLKYIESIRRPVLDGGGNVVEVIGTSIDVTERKRAEEQKERLHKLEAELAHVNRISVLGELAASLAHEIRQPVTAAVMNARACLRWLAHDPPDLEEARAAATSFEQDAIRAGEVMTRVRRFYKLEKDTPAQRELVDLNETIRQIAALLRNEAAQYSIPIKVVLANNLPQIVADRVQIQQVLMNLLLNAVEATKDTAGELKTAAEITVESQLSAGGEVSIVIRDTGKGLPPEHADRIFDPFFTTKPQGTGMGLAISRSLVESYGGRLWASANLGPGATFHFTLPISVTKGAEPSHQ